MQPIFLVGHTNFQKNTKIKKKKNYYNFILQLKCPNPNPNSSILSPELTRSPTDPLSSDMPFPVPIPSSPPLALSSPSLLLRPPSIKSLIF
ncbi:hypothetical protein HYC85_011384 [Camellia sinensis]|uniref:Uncharacterized protein n=1 Tax=Camellia sinensis TaxID=4442 RepID=A0A7J7HAW4_CAMSI|nr:hypothetical protein HYC85_011384 [Camellia sinensis]